MGTVVDDRSFIVDLGDIALEEVPDTVDPGDYPAGARGEHDDLPAIEGHMYLVRTVDSDTRQWAAFRVTEHASASVVLQWWRSNDQERFVSEGGCLCP